MNFDFNFFFPCYYWHLISKQLFVSIDKTTISLYGYAKNKASEHQISGMIYPSGETKFGHRETKIQFSETKKGKIKTAFR